MQKLNHTIAGHLKMQKSIFNLGGKPKTFTQLIGEQQQQSEVEYLDVSLLPP